MARDASTGPAGQPLRRLHSHCCGTAGDVITRRGAGALLARSARCDLPVDLFMVCRPVIDDLHIVQINPAPVRQRSLIPEQAIGQFASTIDDDTFGTAERLTPALLWHTLLRELRRPAMRRRERAAIARAAGPEGAIRAHITFG